MHPKSMIKSISSIILFVIICTSCGFNSMYNQAIEIPKSEWDKAFLAKFDIPVKDTLNGFDLFLSVRNTNNYPYSNFHVFITTIAPNGNIKKDTLEVSLADERGKWYGSGLGGIWESEYIYKKNIRFPISGTYRLEVVHAMRDNILKGIKDIGIKVEKSN